MCATRPRCSFGPCSKTERGALDEAPIPLLPDVLEVVDDHLAVRQHVRGRPRHLLPLVGGVIDAHVKRLLAEDVLLVRVPYDEVGVGAYGEGPFVRVETEDLGGCGAGDLHEAVHRDPSCSYPAVPEEV